MPQKTSIFCPNSAHSFQWICRIFSDAQVSVSAGKPGVPELHPICFFYFKHQLIGYLWIDFGDFFQDMFLIRVHRYGNSAAVVDLTRIEFSDCVMIKQIAFQTQGGKLWLKLDGWYCIELLADGYHLFDRMHPCRVAIRGKNQAEGSFDRCLEILRGIRLG